METPLQQLDRLVLALDTLVARETTLIAISDWEGAGQVQQRMLAVVDAIAPLSRDLEKQAALPAALKARISAIMAREQGALDLYRAHMQRIHAELKNTQAAQTRLSTLRPVYFAPKRPARATSQSGVFSAHG